MIRKIIDKKGEYFRTKTSGIVLVVLSSALAAWYIAEAIFSGEGLNFNDIFLLLFMMATSLTGWTILYIVFQKEILSGLSSQKSRFNRTILGLSWPIFDEALHEIGQGLAQLYNDETQWVLYGLLPALAVKDKAEDSPQRRFLIATNDSRFSGDNQGTESMKRALGERDLKERGIQVHVSQKKGHEIVTMTGRAGAVALGLVITAPRKTRLWGEKWIKSQKRQFLKEAIEECIYKLSSLQAEWEERLKAVDFEGLAMVLRMMSHEAAANLSIVLGSKGHTDSEEEALERAIHIIRQIPVIPSLGTGFFEARPGSMPLDPIIKSTIKAVVNIWPKISIELRSNLEKGKEISVIGDKQLHSVFQNVIFNASSHAKSKVEINIEPSEDGKLVLINVYDDGSGIPYERRDWIFDLSKAYATDYRPRGGGVGLYIARRIARNVGGDVFLGSPKDGKKRSNHFTIRLQTAQRGKNETS